MPEPARLRFVAREAVAVTYTGTNHTDLAAVFGPDWTVRLTGRPFTVGDTVYLLDGDERLYVMSPAARDALTVPAGEG